MWRAYIILGSNIEPEENIRTAFRLLGEKIRLLRRSSVWETAPVGTGGSNFLNLVLIEVPNGHPQDFTQVVDGVIGLRFKISQQLSGLLLIDEKQQSTLDNRHKQKQADGQFPRNGSLRGLPLVFQKDPSLFYF